VSESFEAAFHAARRMWADVDGTLHLAAPGDARRHIEWLMSLYGSQTVVDRWATITRGYYLDGVCALYVGDFFKAPTDPVVVARLVADLRRLFDVKEFWFGVKPGRRLYQWEPLKPVEADRIDDFLALLTAHAEKGRL
jgi:hypothetical protein